MLPFVGKILECPSCGRFYYKVKFGSYKCAARDGSVEEIDSLPTKCHNDRCDRKKLKERGKEKSSARENRR